MAINGDQEKELIEKVNEIHTGMAILGVQMESLQTCMNTFKETRKSTCPMGTAIDRIGNKADDNIEDIKSDRKDDKVRDKWLTSLETSIQSWKLTLITVGAIGGIIGAVLGILAKAGAL